MQLGFAVIPLIHFTSNAKIMGSFAISTWLKIGAWLSALVIVFLNIKLIIDEITSFFFFLGDGNYLIKGCVLLLILFVFILLLYITFEPIVKYNRKSKNSIPHGDAISLQTVAQSTYKQIAITVDFSKNDKATIQHALSLGGQSASYLLIHIVESAGAIRLGDKIMDNETLHDTENLKKYQLDLVRMGYSATTELGYGKSAQAISRIINNSSADLLVMGAHGHRGLKDIIWGSTVDSVRHSVKIPVLIVK
jgi:manganese transport protein